MIVNNIQHMIQVVKEHKPEKIMVQLPAGLMRSAMPIVEAFQATGIAAIVCGKPTYGACDLADVEAYKTRCDLLVHVGHTEFYKAIETQVPVIYVPWHMDIAVDGIDLTALREKRIGLVTTIQHAHLMDMVAEKLIAAGKEVVIGGQILGCWTVNATRITDDVDALLYVGSGCFHPEGIKITKPVYTLNVETRTVERIDTNKIVRKRYNNIFRAKDARTFGILVTTKGGQRELLGNAERLQKRIQKRNKKAYIIVVEEITDENLHGIPVDAFINTACPRIADDHFSKPLVNASDMEEVLHEDP